MGVMRLGYAHVRVTDMAEAKDHYANTMGLYETLSDVGPDGANRTFYKAWDEWVPHGFTPARATVEAKLARPEWKVEIVITAATS